MFKKSRRELINQAVEHIEFDAYAFAQEIVNTINRPSCYIADITDYHGVVRRCLVLNQVGSGGTYDLTKYFPKRTRNRIYCYISYDACNEQHPPGATSWCSIKGVSGTDSSVISTYYPNSGLYNTEKIFTQYRTLMRNGSIQSLTVYCYSSSAPDLKNAPVYIDIDSFHIWVTENYTTDKTDSAYNLDYALQDPFCIWYNSNTEEIIEHATIKLHKTDDGYYYVNTNLYSMGVYWKYPFRMLANVQYYLSVDTLIKNDHDSSNTSLGNLSKLAIKSKNDMSTEFYSKYITGIQDKTVNSGILTLPKVTEDTDVIFCLEHYGKERTYFKNFRIWR